MSLSALNFFRACGWNTVVSDMMNRFKKESALYDSGVKYVIGIDEVGRGPLAGPVVAAAVCFEVESCRAKGMQLQAWWKEIVDSKALTAKKREQLAEYISLNSTYALGTASVDEIESVNILQGSLLAMRRAAAALIKQLSGSAREGLILLVDGRNIIPELIIRQEAIVKGDRVVHSIAAASVMAKVHRDRLMESLGRQYPQYGLEKHKGYGTRHHIEAIKSYGLSPIHRASFCGNIV